MKAKIQTKIFFDVFESPIGMLFLVFSGKHLVGISFEKPVCKRGSAPESFKRELRGYFEGKTREFTQSTIFFRGNRF